MDFLTFDSSFFDQTVTFQLADLTVGQRGGTTETLPYSQVHAPGTVQGGAFVEPDRAAHRTEAHEQPLGRKRWRVITSTNPAAWLNTLGVDDTVTWMGVTLRILKDPYDGTQGHGGFWVAECEEFGPS